MELRRVAELLTQIEAEALRLVEGERGASALSIVGRAASARRQLDEVLGHEPVRDPVAVSVAGMYVRRIRLGVTELKLSAGAAANLVGLTEEEVRTLSGGKRAIYLPICSSGSRSVWRQNSSSRSMRW